MGGLFRAPLDAREALAEPFVVGQAGPPIREQSPRDRVRSNLLSSRFNVALTVAFALVGSWVAYRLASWVLVTADWAIVRINLRLFMVGRFPPEQLWRVWASIYLLAGLLGLSGGAMARPTPAGEPGPDARLRTAMSGRSSRVVAAIRRSWPMVVAVVVLLGFTRTPAPTVLTLGLVVSFLAARAIGRRVPARRRRWLWAGVVLGLVASVEVVTAGRDGVGWDDWGGLHLTVFATVAGIALAFPLGLLLALGRRSSLPGLRVVSAAYIEGFRAVPLVALLFVGHYMIGFLYPTSVDPPSELVRAVIAITLFEAAYIAEIVRGGLQAVPFGQIEAAQALGLSQPKVLRLVVLPQALRAVIPAMVGQFISLFKDTSLLSIVQFFELLTVAETVTKQDAFVGQGLGTVTLAFVGFLYWAGCSTMAGESRLLEQRLGLGER